MSQACVCCDALLATIAIVSAHLTVEASFSIVFVQHAFCYYTERHVIRDKTNRL